MLGSGCWEAGLGEGVLGSGCWGAGVEEGEGGKDRDFFTRVIIHSHAA